MLVLVLVSALAAFTLVAAQLLWKQAVTAAGISMQSITVQKVLTLVFSPRVLGGAALYASAAGLYLYLLAKYEYHIVQAVFVSLALVLAFLASAVFLRERITGISLLGLAFLLVGIILIMHK
ncbi:MAG: hypothetical protein Q8Q11_00260 [bacterium]|nr:hypothetical protein [bacterium]MDZ4248211.1 hypothetical protein [Patescibacteria group bacterium]